MCFHTYDEAASASVGGEMQAILHLTRALRCAAIFLNPALSKGFKGEAPHMGLEIFS